MGVVAGGGPGLVGVAMILPEKVLSVVRDYHRGCVTPTQCQACSSICCSQAGFAILENVLEIYDLYTSGKLKRKGYRFPKGLELVGGAL